MADVADEPPLHGGQRFQFPDSLLQIRGHLVHRDRQRCEIVGSPDGHAFIQLTGGQAQRRPPGLADRPDHLQGHEIGDGRQPEQERRPRGVDRALDVAERGDLTRHGEDVVDGESFTGGRHQGGAHDEPGFPLPLARYGHARCRDVHSLPRRHPLTQPDGHGIKPDARRGGQHGGRSLNDHQILGGLRPGQLHQAAELLVSCRSQPLRGLQLPLHETMHPDRLPDRGRSFRGDDSCARLLHQQHPGKDQHHTGGDEGGQQHPQG